MAETSTFSALIDEAVLRSQRKDRINDIVSYARSTIRECQVLAYFEQDLIEESLTVDVVPYIWSRPLRLRTLLAARPADIFTRRGKDLWFNNRPPGQHAVDEQYFLYLSGDTFIFSGTDLEATNVIDIAYFVYSRKFIYYAVADRPATFDPATELWSYHVDYDVSDATRTTARELVSNWLLTYWYDLLLEGTLAKIFKTVGDERSRTAFALFKSMQKDLLSGERVIYLRDDPDLNG